MRASLHRPLCIAALLCLTVAGWCAPQRRRPPVTSTDVVMLSDIHFDPFYDPAKVPELRREPVTRWPEILSRPDSASRINTFTELQSTCAVRGMDSPWSLVTSALHAAKLQRPAPLFVTVSGDLLAHGFTCKFQQLNPTASAAEISAFAAKTIAFITQQLHAEFPSTSIYVTLGNNDSGCGDYLETPDSAFLKSSGMSFAADTPNAVSRAAIASSFHRLGNYSVMLPGPMHNTRLIVLQNIFASSRFKTCEGDATLAPAGEQIAWLRDQLTDARNSDQLVWIMAHIPPGVDVYTTYHRYLFAPGEACNVKQPQMFLSTGALADTIAEFGDIVRFAIFAHTHMDEIHLLQGPEGRSVPAKLVPSVSPINGNEPSFMIAQVTPQTAIVKDFDVYAASNAQGGAWGREYRFSALYGLPDFSAKSVDQLTAHLVADKTGEDEVSRAYQRHFLAGGGTFAALGLQRLWPAYSCSLRETDPAAFKRCMCP